MPPTTTPATTEPEQRALTAPALPSTLAPPAAQPPASMSFEEYLVFEWPDDRRYELYRGQLLVMPNPSGEHQEILRAFGHRLQRAIADRPTLDWVVVGDIGLRTEIDTSRIPDLMVCSPELWAQVVARKGSGVLDFAEVPALVVEVVSENWRSDYQTKRDEYALAGVPVYVLLHAKKSLVRVMADPADGHYRQIIDYRPDQIVQLPGFPELALRAHDLLHPPLVERLMQQEAHDRARLAETLALERDRAAAAEQQAAAERDRAATAEQQAAAERDRAAAAEQQAAAERDRAERLAALLRQQGIELE